MRRKEGFHAAMAIISDGREISLLIREREKKTKSSRKKRHFRSSLADYFLGPISIKRRGLLLDINSSSSSSPRLPSPNPARPRKVSHSPLVPEIGTGGQLTRSRLKLLSTRSRRPRILPYPFRSPLSSSREKLSIPPVSLFRPNFRWFAPNRYHCGSEPRSREEIVGRKKGQ